MMRRVIAALVVVGLAVGVFLLWPRDGEDDPPDTQAAATTPTTTSTPATSTSAGSPVSSVGESHVVETVEEAEQILREHYSLWFRGIFEQDADLIRSTVILPAQVAAAEAQFGLMDFQRAPSSDGLLFTETEVLRADEECLAVWSTVAADFRSGSTSGVSVFRHVGSGWKFLSSWPQREDRWEEDCESSL